MVIKITGKTLAILAALCFIGLALYLYSIKKVGIDIVDAKMATALDEELMPVNITSVFPRGTKQVFCWVQWNNAKVNIELKAKWHYVTDDIPILNNAFTIPRKEGSGGISLTMPEGKVLPMGTYRINITAKDRVLKSLTFKIK